MLFGTIRAEALTRSIEAFSRFLSVAAQANGEQLDFTSVGNDAQVPPRTVREFFSVLEDTLVGYTLPPYRRTKKRKTVATSKFYFFDVGVAHAAQGVTQMAPGTTIYGRALEQLIANELRAYLSYRGIGLDLTYYRSRSQIEVDFIVGDRLAIEVKASGRVGERDAKPLHAAAEDADPNEDHRLLGALGAAARQRRARHARGALSRGAVGRRDRLAG